MTSLAGGNSFGGPLGPMMAASSSDSDALADRLDRCEAALGYRFRDRALLELCLTHASVARTRLASNERLEFLGDAVLGLVVCEMLFRLYPEFSEGELTRVKSVLVSRTTCAELSRRLGLDRLLLVGKGLGGADRIPTSILGAVFESLIAGVYLDGGLEPARILIERVVDEELERAAARDRGRNFKSVLQHLAQKRFGETPGYRLLDEQGPDHSKCFLIAAVIGETTYPAAWGASKKEAEQAAAQNALTDLGEDARGDEEE
ncbi:MAG: ribonuclease III [Planctomycetota bacterium]|nr:ribonuclease III [Planctomycetota bacterium]